MAINLIRVVNQQTLVRSILLDKIDRSQGNSTGYASKAKLKVYVPYSNPVDSSVKGYTDLVPTDEVLLSSSKGTISGLAAKGYVTYSVVSSALLTTAIVTSASHAATNTTINGTTFLSVSPDVTYVTFTNLVGATQKVPRTAFGSITAIQIVVPDAAVTIGTPGVGWKVTVQANSKSSNTFTL